MVRAGVEQIGQEYVIRNHSGFAEAHLHRILKKIGDLHGDNSNLVAIVNPFRYGLGMVDIKIQFCLNRIFFLL